MWTADREELMRRFKLIFPGRERGDRPVVVSKTYSLGFLPYKDKAIKLPALWETTGAVSPTCCWPSTARNHWN